MKFLTAGIVIAIVLGVFILVAKNAKISSPVVSPTATATTMDNNSTPTPTATSSVAPAAIVSLADGLQIQDEVVGTGAAAEAGKSVTVNYTGTLTNGSVFDSSLNPGRTPFTF